MKWEREKVKKKKWREEERKLRKRNTERVGENSQRSVDKKETAVAG